MAHSSLSAHALFALAVSCALMASCLGAESQGLHFTIEGGKVQAVVQPEAKAKVASLDTRVGTPVLELSPVIFGGNVLRGEASIGHPEQWVVHFCPSWWEQCQAMLKAYAKEADRWQGSFVGDLMGPKVRFAMVDCASHKVLCNEQLVEEYPTIVHYQGGAQASRWTASGKNDGQRFKVWLKAQLGPATVQPQERSLGLLSQGLTSDLLLVGLVLAVNCWVFASTASAVLEEPKASGGAAPPGGLPQPGCPTEGVARFLPAEWVCQGGVVL